MDRILIIDYIDGGQFMIDMEHLAAISYDAQNSRLEFYFTFRPDSLNYKNINKRVAESIQKAFLRYKNYVGAPHTAPLKEPDDINKLEHI